MMSRSLDAIRKSMHEGGGLRKASREQGAEGREGGREMSRAIFQNVADKAATISADAAATEKNHSRSD